MKTTGDIFAERLSQLSDKLIEISMLPSEQISDAMNAFMYGDMLYNLTNGHNLILESVHYKNGLLGLVSMNLKNREFDAHCKIYSEILYKYYRKDFNAIFDELIGEEKYEECSMVKAYTKNL